MSMIKWTDPNNNRVHTIIPKSELVHAQYYNGYCRNAKVARWNIVTNKFYYWRTKFDSKFVETINHPEDDDGFDLFLPKELVTYGVEWIPIESYME